MSKRRQADDGGSPKTKKRRTIPENQLSNDMDVDFPRGGGTSLAPSEVKALKAEALQEANEELFKVSTFLFIAFMNHC